MKISGKQLEAILFKLKYNSIGYSDSSKDFEVEINMTKEDPGSGVMTDAMTLSSTKEHDEEDRVEHISVEIYPMAEQQEPRVSETKTYRLKKP